MRVVGYNLTDPARQVLLHARENASRLGHEYIGAEHLLLGLTDDNDGVAAAVLTNRKVNIPELRRSLEEARPRGTAHAIAPDLPYTSRARKVLEVAMEEARELGHSYVGTEHLLLALLRTPSNLGGEALADAGVTFDAARAEVLRLLGHAVRSSPPASVEDVLWVAGAARRALVVAVIALLVALTALLLALR